MKKIIIIFVLSLFYSPLSSQWVQTNGIKGTDQVSCIQRSSHSMFACTNSGLFKSTDEGISWKISCNGLKYTQVSSLASISEVLFAGTSNGLSISYDDGQNWIDGGYQGNYVYHIFAHNNRLFLWTGDELYYSDDLGLSFNYLFYCGNVKSMYAFNNFLYFASFGTGVYRSSDNGLTWNLKNNGLVTLNASCFTSSGNYLFLGTQNHPDGHVYKSTDNGDSWVPCSYDFPINNICASSSEGNYIYANAGPEMYVSTDSGNSWNNSSYGLPGYWLQSIFSYNSKTFAAPVFSEIYMTTNHGVNWTISDSGLYNTAVSSFTSDGGYLFAAAGSSGLWRTSDNGAFWEMTGLTASNNLSINTVSKFNGKLYAGCSGIYDNLYVSSNLGVNWSVLYGFNGTNINDITSKDTVLFAATNYGVKKSTNGGLNWTQTSLSPSLTVTKLFVKDAYLYAASYSGIYYTSNLGTTWLASTGISTMVNDISANGNNMYAAAYNKVYKSTNNGSSWTAANLNSMNCYRLLSVNNAVLVTGNQGVFLSSNGGADWNSVSDGLSLLDSRALYSLNDYVFLGTYGAGVYKRPVSQIIGIKNISSGIPEYFSLYQNYPNPFNPVTKIKFDVAAVSGNFGSQHIKIEVYDMLGKDVKTLVNEPLRPGAYEVTFDGSSVPSGIYYCRMLSGNELKNTIKMMLIK
ncbi:MAG: T9SS type A sorting domain-containing protein [Bacteroidetes bacterium]|nr:T9SS type A sorting domain-containing protein [Bacteroidota bacterium]